MRSINLKEVKERTKEEPRKTAIYNLVSEFNNEIEQAFIRVSEKFSDKIKVGYNRNEFNGMETRLIKNIEAINELVDFYSTLLEGKEVSLQLFKELQNLPFESPTQIECELKKRYLQWNKITIPNFPNFKIDKLIEAYDFPIEDLVLIEKIVSISEEMGKTLSFDYEKYYDNDAQELVLTDIYKDELLEQFAVYISLDQVSDILSLHLLCVALNNLKRAPYEFNSLPEIDFRLMSRITNDGNDIALDIDKVEYEILPSLDSNIKIISRGSVYKTRR